MDWCCRCLEGVDQCIRRLCLETSVHTIAGKEVLLLVVSLVEKQNPESPCSSFYQYRSVGNLLNIDFYPHWYLCFSHLGLPYLILIRLDSDTILEWHGSTVLSIPSTTWPAAHQIHKAGGRSDDVNRTPTNLYQIPRTPTYLGVCATTQKMGNS